MDATTLERALATLLLNGFDGEEGLDAAVVDALTDCGAHDLADEPASLEHVATFAEAGVMTTNAGLVLSFSDGSEFQLTLVRSR